MDAANGTHWLRITETLGTLSLGAVAMSPANPDSLRLGLGDPFDVHVRGFFHTDDGGATWLGPVVLLGRYPGFAPLQATSVRDIAYDSTGQVVLAATDVGLFRSTEGGGGTGWTLIDVDVSHAPQGFWSLGRVGGQVWIATSQDLTQTGLPGRVWRSVDDGLTWARVTAFTPASDVNDVSRTTVAISPSDAANPNSARVYL